MLELQGPALVPKSEAQKMVMRCGIASLTFARSFADGKEISHGFCIVDENQMRDWLNDRKRQPGQ